MANFQVVFSVLPHVFSWLLIIIFVVISWGFSFNFFSESLKKWWLHRRAWRLHQKNIYRSWGFDKLCPTALEASRETLKSLLKPSLQRFYTVEFFVDPKGYSAFYTMEHLQRSLALAEENAKIIDKAEETWQELIYRWLEKKVQIAEPEVGQLERFVRAKNRLKELQFLRHDIKLFLEQFKTAKIMLKNKAPLSSKQLLWLEDLFDNLTRARHFAAPYMIL